MHVEIISVTIIWIMPLAGSIHFDGNTTFSFFGCSPQDETMTLPCACLHGLTVGDEDYCSHSNPFILQEKCQKLISASYFLQYNEAENELQISLNLNSSLDMEMTMFTGNCSFDCSGESYSPCRLSSNTFNYSTKSGPFHLKNINPGNYCFRMTLLGHELCIIHTRLYTFEKSEDIKNRIHLKRSYILLLVITIAAFTFSTLLSIYIYKRGVKSVQKVRMRNLMEIKAEEDGEFNEI